MERYIPLHLVEEILLRLDPHTLIRCASVCRDWNKLITDPYFISRQTLVSRNQILLIKACHCKESARNNERKYIYFPHCRVTYSLHQDNDQFALIRTIENPDIDDFKDTEVIGTSNGLVCLANKSSFKFILWNPAVRRYVWLPFAVAWEETLCSAGFGFDHTNHDFKIVNLVHRRIDDFDVQIDSVWIFSYATWSWKRLACSFPPSYIRDDFYPCVSFNGVLHWMAGRTGGGNEFILTFDLTREEFGQIPFPETLDPNAIDDYSITTTGDSLSVIQERSIIDGPEKLGRLLSVLIMTQQESWTNITTKPEALDPYQILGLRKNGDLMLEMGDGQIHRYNPTTTTNNLVEALENTIFFRYYTESLYLLEKGEDVNSY